MKRTFAIAAAFALVGTAALAELSTDATVKSLQEQGFTRIEVRNGLTQTKVEAIRGTEKVEIVYDAATGAVLKQETDRVEAGDDIAPGVSIRNRNRDFLRATAGEGWSDDDDEEDEDDENGRGRGSDDDDDESDEDRDDDGDDDGNDDGDDSNDDDGDDSNDDDGDDGSDDDSDDDSDDGDDD